MLLSGSLAKASRAASRIEATLRSASARRLRADAFVAVVVFAIRQWVGIALGLSRSLGTKWLARGRTARATTLPRVARSAAAMNACAIPDSACGPAREPR